MLAIDKSFIKRIWWRWRCAGQAVLCTLYNQRRDI